MNERGLLILKRGPAVKINLSEYPEAGKIASRAIAEAVANGTETIYTTHRSDVASKDVDFIRHGRRSWLEWWHERLASLKAKS